MYQIDDKDLLDPSVQTDQLVSVTLWIKGTFEHAEIVLNARRK